MSDFQRFASLHPEVEAELVRLARRAKSRGRTRIGVKALWEVMRWNFWMKWEPGEEPFKLNNNYTSRYARRIMERYPDLAGMFETRKLRGGAE